MLGRLAGRSPNAGTPAAVGRELWRLMVTKASNRAAVHGTKLPTGDAVDNDEVEKEMKEKKEEKEKKREEIEKAVDSKISGYAAPPTPVK